MPLAVMAREAQKPPVEADRPLTSAETQEYQRHFRFLKDHRKLLRLKLNAQEDLLLNGVRPPEHHGICQHLLSKVNYTAVSAAAERLDPRSRVAFCEGVLRFADGLPYLLLYLESLQVFGHAAAPLALARALSRIRFEDVQEGQMRRVLELMVGTFPANELPALFLGVLENRAFREALQETEEKLPEALLGIAAPMRAVHSHIIKGRQRGTDSSALSAGTELVLCGDVKWLEARSPAVRARLITEALRALPAAKGRHLNGLSVLLDSLDPKSSVGAELRLMRVGALMSAGLYDDAQARLKVLAAEQDCGAKAKAWLEALNSPRLDQIALLRERGPRPEDAFLRLRPAFCLRNQRPLWVRTGGPEQVTTFDQHLEVLQRATVPGVVPSYSAGLNPQTDVYISYPMQHGARPLPQAAQSSGEERLFAHALEGTAILAALSLAGIVLPDAALKRFEVDPSGRLWLLDTWGARLEESMLRTTQMLDLAGRFCSNLLGATYLPGLDAESAATIAAPRDFPTLLAILRRISAKRYS